MFDFKQYFFEAMTDYGRECAASQAYLFFKDGQSVEEIARQMNVTETEVECMITDTAERLGVEPPAFGGFDG